MKKIVTLTYEEISVVLDIHMTVRDIFQSEDFDALFLGKESYLNDLIETLLLHQKEGKFFEIDADQALFISEMLELYLKQFPGDHMKDYIGQPQEFVEALLGKLKEVTKHIKTLNKEEVDVVLGIFSTFRSVFPTKEFKDFILGRESCLDNLIGALLEKGNLIFVLNEKRTIFISDAIELYLKQFTEDYMETYIGQSRKFVEELLHKLKSDFV